jgi:two-component system, NarL family, sensor histidine kinase UhpB
MVRPLLRRFLAVRLFTKILVANAVLIGGASVLTGYVAYRMRALPESFSLEAITALALAAIVVALVVNVLILRLALKPLRLLEQTAAQVRDGDLQARAPYSALADREFEGLTRLFNAMLDGLDVYRQRLREVAAKALNAEEEERKRISRELHDDTAQRLAALLIRLRIARDADPAERDSTLEEVRREIAEVLEEIRRFARGLRPPALDELGLAAAVESYARNLSEATSLRVELETETLKGLLASEIELAVYRIVQEALSNVVRHAGATRAVVRLERADGRLIATVSDDGVGFPADEVLAGRSGHGLGLFGMQERAAYVGGTVSVRSGRDNGTTVRVEVPMAAPPGRL